MDNNITNINEMSQEQIMEAIGQDDGSSKGVNIPRLGINRSPEDDDGNQLPVGNLFTFDSSVGQNVYGKPVTFRPFISAMQYMHYDPDKSEYVNRSIIFKNWKEEAYDMLQDLKAQCDAKPTILYINEHEELQSYLMWFARLEDLEYEITEGETKVC